ncbi:hypothetical protein V2J09_008981 [Rumex salicifolius]
MGSIEEAVAEVRDERPFGIRMAESLTKSPLSYNTHQLIVLVITFLAYTSYHLARKAPSVVKSALDPNSASNTAALQGMSLGNSSTSGWAPFNGSDGTELLGYLDVGYLSAYAMGQFFSGQLGDRTNLRVLLAVGMTATGLFTACFGLAYWLNIHTFYYFLSVQMLAGLFQSTGWPSVVAVVGNWFGKRKRGLIMGVWNAHTSVGNIAGALIASNLLQFGWGWSLVVPGLIIVVMGLVVYVSLPVSPLTVGMSVVYDDDDSHGGGDRGKRSAEESLLDGSADALLTSGGESIDERSAIGFLDAWKIPGVATFAFCLFFAKLVAYTFLYWLPFYISYTEIGGEYLSSKASGNLSTLFDVGGVFGGILAGYVSDRLGARAITAAAFTYTAIPALFCYKTYGYMNIYVNGILMFVTGVFVNGPYALITTAVSVDLGTHSSLKGKARALATVTSIIDGTGSIGAAIGPLVTGYLSNISWSSVFLMLMSSALLAGILLSRLVWDEIKAIIDRSRTPSLTTSSLA